MRLRAGFNCWARSVSRDLIATRPDFCDGRACPCHPRLSSSSAVKTWMPGTSPGTTAEVESDYSKHLEIFALFPFRYFRLEALDFGVLDVDVVVDKLRTQRLAKESIFL